MESKRVRMGGLLGLVFLHAACNGRVHNLGDEGSAGGGSDAGGKSTITAYGGGMSYGGGAVGGQLSMGGAISYGGGAVGGGMSVGGAINNSAYPLSPTLPVDPNCSCASSSQICNAQGTCVDRCESSGVCATWLTSSSVTAMYAEGSTLYYATAPKTDPLGNPGKNASLYRVEYPGGTPTRLATGMGKVWRIVGRYGEATFAEVESSGALGLQRIADAGQIAELDSNIHSPASMRDSRIVYESPDRLNLRFVDVGKTLVPTTLLTLQSDPSDPAELEQPQVLSTVIWFGRALSGSQYGNCTIGLSDLSASPKCKSGDYFREGSMLIVGTAGDKLYVNFTWAALLILEADSEGVTQRTLANADGTSFFGQLPLGTSLSEGWLYSWLGSSDAVTKNRTVRLVRYPTAVGRLPQEVMPFEIATPSVVGVSDPINGSIDRSDSTFAVSSAGIFWIQNDAEPNDGQYIFHAPLPPQPCDSELPCANTAEVCTNGFCKAP